METPLLLSLFFIVGPVLLAVLVIVSIKSYCSTKKYQKLYLACLDEIRKNTDGGRARAEALVGRNVKSGMEKTAVRGDYIANLRRLNGET